MTAHINDYQEYLRVLHREFGGSDSEIDDAQIDNFIDEYCLNAAWNIDISDVRRDIRMQKSKLRRNGLLSMKRSIKRILSYEDYLERLHEEFGMSDRLPERDEIEDFVDKYELMRHWKVDADDVAKDLSSVIAGHYDEMLRDSRIGQPDIITRSILAAKRRNRVLPKISRNKDNSIAENIISKQNSKCIHTIFIDGDNHIDEGQKGISNTANSVNLYVYFSQEGAKKKFDKKYRRKQNVVSRLVEPGDQAVDKQIESDVMKIIGGRNQRVSIISQDRDFERLKKHNSSLCGLGTSISVYKSVKEAISI